MSRSRHITPLVIVAIGLTSLLAPHSNGVAQDADPLRILEAIEQRLAKVIANCEPAVVSVVRVRAQGAKVPTGSRTPLTPLAPPIEPSWLDPEHPNYVPTDFGSGVLIDDGGLVLTTHHVIDEATRLYVRLWDGTGCDAQVVAADPRSDLAVLKIPPKRGKPLPLGRAEAARKGHFVIALGNPYATARDGRASASWGMISNVARSLRPVGPEEPATLHHSGTLLQTDAKLGIGSSGGALVNLRGELIGVVTALPAWHGFEEAAGLAIPMDDSMRRIVAILRQGREVEYGFLGVTPIAPAAVAPDAPATPVERGAIVSYVFEGTPAFRSGIADGDHILRIDGKPVAGPEDLVLQVSPLMAGTTVKLDIVRRGKPLAIPVELAKYPVRGNVVVTQARGRWRGIECDYLTVLLRDRTSGAARLREFPQGGVLVTRVDANSQAARAGIAVDQVITALAGKPVGSPAEFLKAGGALRGAVALETDRGKVSVEP